MGKKRLYLRRVAKSLSLILLSTLFLFSSNSQSLAVEAGPTFTAVSSGEHFTCGLTSIGEVYCWGDKTYSQLGTAAVDYNSTPNKVYQITNAVEIAAGRDFACARISDGSVACWGRGDLGQTGDGYLSTENRIFATRVHGVTTAIRISAGESHACVLKKDQNVYCWGQNQLFQLGNNLSRIETMPVKVEGISAITQISSGLNHTCALTETRFVYCWGDNKFGQLGIGTPVILKEKPSIVLGLKNVISLQMGYNSSCASIEKVGFNCWGWGIDGELAQTDRFNRSLPEKISLASLVDSPTALVAISIGKYKACGLLNSGKSNALLCWGTTVTTDPVSGSTGLSVSLGSDHGCVVQTTGTVACWGWNHKGQLGRATISNSVLSLSTVSGFPDWTYWIKSWSIKYEDNLGILSWEGGSGKYIVSIESKGIVCETLTIRTCKFGPLESTTTYNGRITAQNSPTENSRTINISFKTESLTSAFDAYNAAQAKLALQAESDRLTLIAVEKASALIKIADEIIERAVAEEKAISNLSIVEEQKAAAREKSEVLLIINNLRNEKLKLEKSLIFYKETSPNIHKLLSAEISAFPAFSQELQSSTLSQAQTFQVEFQKAFRSYINKLTFIYDVKSKIICNRKGIKKTVIDINPTCPLGYKK